jgi:hypothetical protein
MSKGYSAVSCNEIEVALTRDIIEMHTLPADEMAIQLECLKERAKMGIYMGSIQLGNISPLLTVKHNWDPLPVDKLQKASWPNSYAPTALADY